MKNSSKKEKTTARVLFFRILAGFLAFLMIAGVALVALEFFFESVAAETPETDGYAFSAETTEGDFRVAVALRWKSNAASAYGVVSPYGFAFGEADIQKNLRSFTPVWLSDETEIVAAADRNMKVYGDTLTDAGSEAETDIGGYNVELRFSSEYEEYVRSLLEGTSAAPESETEKIPETESYEESLSPSGENTETPAESDVSSGTESGTAVTTTAAAQTEAATPSYDLSELTLEIWDTLEQLEALFVLEYDHVFPAYIKGEHTLRIGAFPNYSEASAAAAAIGARLDGYTVSVVSPSTDGIMLLNGACDTILFEYEGSDSCSGAVCARQREGSDRVYLCLSANSYLYDGVFCFRRYDDGEYSNLTLINLVPLLEYCEGVLPAEVYTSWPDETLKAFAVTVNSFVICNRNRRYTAFGCDLLASSADQNYKGRTGVTDRVIAACEAVNGKILTYTNDAGRTTVADCAYSSSQGGYSVAPQYVWGGNAGDYLCSQPTMWEDYTDVSWGFWTFEISPKELANLVKKYNSSLISGTYITDVSFETAPQSSYVYSISLTDNKGKTANVVKCSCVNSLMGSYSHSANFVIGKDSVDYTWDEVLSTRVIDLSSNYSGNLSVRTSDNIFNASASLFDFIFRGGQSSKDESAAMYVKTSSGIAILASEKDIPVNTLPDADGVYTYVADYGSFLIVNTLKQHSETLKAENSGDFVIAGRGFGHGVGMSQWGACHLGRSGALYNQILTAYYPGTELVSFASYLNK